jgi:hypothetical protein
VIQTPSPRLEVPLAVLRVRVEDAFQSSSAPPTAAVARAANATGRTVSPSQPASDGVSDSELRPSQPQAAAASVGARTAGPAVESQSVGASGISTPGLPRALDLEGPWAGPDSDSPFGQPQPEARAASATAVTPGRQQGRDHTLMLPVHLPLAAWLWLSLRPGPFKLRHPYSQRPPLASPVSWTSRLPP